jgi:hypothetical protein
VDVVDGAVEDGIGKGRLANQMIRLINSSLSPSGWRLAGTS